MQEEDDPRALQSRISDAMSRLSEGELLWRARQPFLESCGYRLRPRYRPGWTASWLNRNDTDYFEHDDWHRQTVLAVIDAIRISDNKPVFIKAVPRDGDELKLIKIIQQLPEEPSNHCIPVLDCLEDPEDPAQTLIVMPLMQPMSRPPFETVGNVIDFVEQILEGIAFLHKHGIAHRDCSRPNIMLDPQAIYPLGFHPVMRGFLPDLSDTAPHLSRCDVDLKYYFVDFGISVHIPSEAQDKLVRGQYGRDQEPPELSNTVPYDPFKLDVFIIGNMFDKEFLQKFANVTFLGPLIQTMKTLEPSSRPSAEEALQYWREIRRGLSPLTSIGRLRGKDEPWPVAAAFDAISTIRLCMRISRYAYMRVLHVISGLRP